MRSYQNATSNAASKIGDDDEVNYIMSEESDPMLETSKAPLPIKTSKSGKVRRGRGARGDIKNIPKNYYKQSDASVANSSMNLTSSHCKDDVTIRALTIFGNP
jgi:hypothetical protein